MRLSAVAVLAAQLLACDEPYRCPPLPEILPAAGTGAAQSGQLVPQADEQTLTMPIARDYVEYRFKRDGVSYTARYALSRERPVPVLRYVFVRRPRPLPECGALKGRGPLIDAIELRRNGEVISSGEQIHFSLARCPNQGLTNKGPTEMTGPPDGVGALLGDAEYGWALAPRVNVKPGDEITVTVLDAAGEPFEVFVGAGEADPTVQLGVLSGTGTLRVP